MFLQAKIIKIERNAKGKFVFFSFPFGFHAFIFIKNVLGTRPPLLKRIKIGILYFVFRSIYTIFGFTKHIIN